MLIDNLSFTLESPFFLGLIGNNGSGKTTFLQAILEQVSYEGEIHTSTKKIGYIAQKHQLQFDIKVKDLVVMGAYNKKSVFDNYSKEDYLKVDILLTKVGLGHKKEKSYLQLSGGEQQLVWLAQQLMLEPELLLLDEPTANLDVQNKFIFFNIVKQIVGEGTQVVCVTHDLFFLKKMNGYFLDFSTDKLKIENLSCFSIDEIYNQSIS